MRVVNYKHKLGTKKQPELLFGIYKTLMKKLVILKFANNFIRMF